MSKNSIIIQMEMAKISNGLKAIAVIMFLGFLVLGYFSFSIYSGQAELAESVENALNNKLFSEIVSDMGESVVSVQPSAGTGFVIREDGYILTASHTVNGFANIYVILKDGTPLSATKYKTSVNDLDLAIIKVDSLDLNPVELTNKLGTIETGAKVGFIGYPLLSSEQSTNEGIISFIGFVDNVRKMTINAFVNPGNSGGPLFLADTGEVMGVVIGQRPAYELKDIEFRAEEATEEDTKLILNTLQSMFDELKVGIEKNSRSGIGTIIPVDTNILSHLPTK